MSECQGYRELSEIVLTLHFAKVFLVKMIYPVSCGKCKTGYWFIIEIS
ncbi:hypothetical protein CKO_01733 [Citrobacter koseri ATCC BAA-895]|uniref:Uncharacterized protein n=1 Tax=Citrobacter koseri (strain ATCC BAA-895 / CDC 4225-83 / SGSC4696) TaxID=290338 RepID=A8AH99_CITK8|nr:hypothetical protein CKO_01733 [Citrobacter koseri ATCC BAA-895]